MGKITLWQMIQQGWLVLSILFAASILSISTIVDRYRALKRAQLDWRVFGTQVLRMLRTRGQSAAIEYCESFRQPLARVMAAGLRASKLDPARREQSVHRALRMEMRQLEMRVPILATVGSVTPFVGLYGTVSGIIQAFSDIAEHIGGGPEVVAAGIAEALVATAAGLLVAIPAVIYYNYFRTRLRRLSEEIELATEEVIERFERGDEA